MKMSPHQSILVVHTCLQYMFSGENAFFVKNTPTRDSANVFRNILHNKVQTNKQKKRSKEVQAGPASMPLKQN